MNEKERATNCANKTLDFPRVILDQQTVKMILDTRRTLEKQHKVHDLYSDGSFSSRYNAPARMGFAVVFKDVDKTFKPTVFGTALGLASSTSFFRTLIIVPWKMCDISTIYKELLESNEGDILVKLKDGNQLKIISFLIKKRSLVFKAMLELSMQEAATGVVDLSSQYSLEAFREFMAYIYYNKLYTGSFVPLLFEILCIADYYDVETYGTYISDRIFKLITNVPICLTIAFEARQHGALTNKIYTKCVNFLVEALEPQCYDKNSGDSKAWCCSDHSTKDKRNYPSYHSSEFTVDGQIACIYTTTHRRQGYHADYTSGYKQRCCLHGPKKLAPVDISQLPDFIMDDINSAKIDEESD
ncbi:hypothetical protein EDD11_009183 [Mortierella claussenii]|nr:hypothetical protein EDD11_009183 [Mortierella claussenii]